MHTTKKFIFFITFLEFTISSLYFAYFSNALHEEIWENYLGFTRLVIPDVFIYLNIVDFNSPVRSILFAGIKNSIIPSFLWFIAHSNWQVVILLNSIILFWGLNYFRKIASICKIDERKTKIMLILFALLPSTILYSIGALKEIPTLTFSLGFIYCYIKEKRFCWIMFFFLLVLCRYQMVIALFIFFIADRYNKSSFKVAFIILLFISIAYPFIYNLGVFQSDATDLYREMNQNGSTLGNTIEIIRNSKPGLSALAIFFRVLQSIFEPLFTFVRAPTFTENGFISLTLLAHFTSLCIIIRYWLLALKRFYYTIFIKKSDNINLNLMRLYTFCFVSIIPIAGFSFIQHRYLYPFIPIIMLISATNIKDNKIGVN